MKKVRILESRVLIRIFFFLLLSACSSNHLAPVTDGWRQPVSIQGWHVVQPGETLYSIAWGYGRDYRELAEINHLTSPDRLRVGQRLSLVPISKQQKRGAQASKQISKPITRKPAHGLTVTYKGSITRWRWPAHGKVINRFGIQNNNGIDIAGKIGDPVYAAAAGTVVYSGNNLRGYGNMLIIKHNAEYLSAYAHNSEILVKEGEQVKAGQQIARMGSNETKQVLLHFEIRRGGKPQNPLNLLPPR